MQLGSPTVKNLRTKPKCIGDFTPPLGRFYTGCVCGARAPSPAKPSSHATWHMVSPVLSGCVRMVWHGILRSRKVKTRTPTKPHKTERGAFNRWFPSRGRMRCAIACAEDSHSLCADAPLRKHAAVSLLLIIFTRQAGWNVKATNPYFDFQRKSNTAIELLTNSNSSIRPVHPDGVFHSYGAQYSNFSEKCNTTPRQC